MPDEIPFVTQTPQNGWKEFIVGSVYYKNGVKVKVLQQIDGETYYFDEKGYLQTSWLKHGNTWYYLDSRNSATAESERFLWNGAWYYLGSDSYYVNHDGVWVK